MVKSCISWNRNAMLPERRPDLIHLTPEMARTIRAALQKMIGISPDIRLPHRYEARCIVEAKAAVSMLNLVLEPFEDIR